MEKNDRLLISLLVVAIIVAVAGTWLNLQSLSDNFLLAGMSVAGGGEDVTLDVGVEGTGTNDADGLNSVTASGDDCSAQSGSHLADGETVLCTLNDTMSNATVYWGSNSATDVTLNLSNTLDNSTWEVGYCSISPALVAGTNNAAAGWYGIAPPNTDNISLMVDDADLGNYYTYVCEQAIALGWNETTGAKTNLMTWSFVW